MAVASLATTDFVLVTTEDANGVGTPGGISRAALLSQGALVTAATNTGVGFGTGAGGAVAQASSRTTGVELNTSAGSITLVSAAGSTTPASFTVTNSKVAATDTILVVQKSGTDLYTISVTAVGAGTFQITSNTKSGTTTESPVFNFVVLKGAAA